MTLYGHRYPVLAPHSFRGAIGEFGAPRSGGRIHQGFDVNAACGKPLVAARGGTVIRRSFNGRLDGHYIVIRGTGENRTYRYSHLISAAPVSRGRAGVHRPGRRSSREDRQRRLDRLPPPLRDSPRQALHRSRARAAGLGPLQLALEERSGRQLRSCQGFGKALLSVFVHQVQQTWKGSGNAETYPRLGLGDHDGARGGERGERRDDQREHQRRRVRHRPGSRLLSARGRGGRELESGLRRMPDRDHRSRHDQPAPECVAHPKWRREISMSTATSTSTRTT